MKFVLILLLSKMPQIKSEDEDSIIPYHTKTQLVKHFALQLVGKNSIIQSLIAKIFSFTLCSYENDSGYYRDDGCCDDDDFGNDENVSFARSRST